MIRPVSFTKDSEVLQEQSSVSASKKGTLTKNEQIRRAKLNGVILAIDPNFSSLTDFFFQFNLLENSPITA